MHYSLIKRHTGCMACAADPCIAAVAARETSTQGMIVAAMSMIFYIHRPLQTCFHTLPAQAGKPQMNGITRTVDLV